MQNGSESQKCALGPLASCLGPPRGVVRRGRDLVRPAVYGLYCTKWRRRWIQMQR
jgi:hypothetical protein